MKLDNNWSPGGQLYLLDGNYWGITRKLNTVMVGKQEEVEHWLSTGYQHPNNTIANILTQERNLS